MSLREEFDAIPKKVIKSIKFGVLSPEMIRKYSVMEVTTSEVYDEGGLPVRGGIADRRLGVAEPGSRCETCGQTHDVCPGHFGHIELVKPVIHVGFARIIYDVLRATCPNCGRIMLRDEEIERYRERLNKLKARWRLLALNLHEKIRKKATERMTCPHCGYKRNKVRFERPYYFYEETESGALVKLDPEVLRERLSKVPSEDLELLGINPSVARPEWAILKVLPVPPPHVRPSIQLETGIRSEDDLTHKLVDIIRMNEKLKIAIETGALLMSWTICGNCYNTMWLRILTTSYPASLWLSTEGEPLKGIAQRLKGKEGRFRGSLSGKRVNFSARTVISPDPHISINEVGVPYDIAKVLTVPERVTAWNVDVLREYVIRGPESWPGANYVVTPEGRRIDLRYVKDRKALAERLAPGWIVERHLIDGDIVLFNRQPSLHRVSMMGHLVKVLPGRTFRLHLAVCPPYNADFDGDEMNLHVPQTEEARAEARALMLVEKHIITPRYGGAIIGARQDYIIGAYLLSHKSTFLTKKEVAFLLGAGKSQEDPPEPAILHPVELWTGKQIISHFLPKDLNWVQPTAFKSKCQNAYTCPTDEWIIVINGNLVKGVLDKKSIGAEQVDSLWHRIARDYSPEVARRWLDSSLRLFLRFLDLRGFTFGMDSIYIPPEAYREIDNIIKASLEKVDKLIDDFRSGHLEAMPGFTVEETFENKVTEILSKVREDAAVVVEKYIDKNSEGYLMAKTGARGSIVNIVQMVATLGQQTIRGERIRRGFRTRTLPHFPVGDIGAFSGGFVRNCFRCGLTPVEYFFHARGQRWINRHSGAYCSVRLYAEAAY
ncbi:DNA-directed RNA polymerase subunit A' [Pyrobaculum aerophilum]|uniref:DNA-directed RNA polymerase subunit A' n=1 Tax=Pyrobaculum aerophilum TaxID=13773 RepID=UPI0021632230|nr:DNA-directed RNA polymerase subunit A' [Pyrobaculum aerophilum]